MEVKHETPLNNNQNVDVRGRQGGPRACVLPSAQHSQHCQWTDLIWNQIGTIAYNQGLRIFMYYFYYCYSSCCIHFSLLSICRPPGIGSLPSLFPRKMLNAAFNEIINLVSSSPCQLSYLIFKLVNRVVSIPSRMIALIWNPTNKIKNTQTFWFFFFFNYN